MRRYFRYIFKAYRVFVQIQLIGLFSYFGFLTENKITNGHRYMLKENLVIIILNMLYLLLASLICLPNPFLEAPY